MKAIRLFLIAGLILLGACAPEHKQPSPKALTGKTIKVFCSFPGYSYLPFYDWKSSSQPGGFEPELIRIIAKELGAQIEYVYPKDAKGDPRIYSLTEGNADLVIFAFTITDERRSYVDISKPYLENGIGALVASDSNIHSVKDLEERKILALSHTTAYPWAKSNLPKARVIGELPKGFSGEVPELIQRGDADAFLIDQAHLRWISKEMKQLRVLPQLLTREEFGIAVRKGEKVLLENVNSTLDKLERDGTLLNLKKKWLLQSG